MQIICSIVAVLFLGMGVGCMHTPLPGATRGVVLLENMDYMNFDSEDAPTGILTGIAIDEHTILTAAHLFRYDPEPAHPLEINGQRVEYTVLSDGWRGHRDSSKEMMPKMTKEVVLTDVLLLSVDEPVIEFAEFVEFGIKNYDRLSAITLLTNEIESGLPVAVPLRRLGFKIIEGMVYASLPQRQQDKYYLSGSPVVGSYSDGSIVLLGLASADGDVNASFLGIQLSKEPVIWITPIDFLEARRSASQAESN